MIRRSFAVLSCLFAGFPSSGMISSVAKASDSARPMIEVGEGQVEMIVIPALAERDQDGEIRRVRTLTPPRPSDESSVLGQVQSSSAILFDDLIRDSLRSEARAGRDRAAMASDIGVGVLVGAPFVAGTLGGALIGRGDGRLALRMLLVDGLATAVNQGVTNLTKELARRERPYGRECEDDPEYDSRCDSTGYRYRSFFSGHTSSAFTGASLICSHGIQMNLYGGRGATVASCSLAMGMAATVGVLRIVADQHYSTDVLVGMVAGAVTGFVVPALIGYSAGQGDGDHHSGGSNAEENQLVLPVFQYGGRF